jgi:hypothetical protein
LAHDVCQPVQQRDREGAPSRHEGRSDIVLALGFAGSRKASTPVSMNRPPLRYSARPVRPSMSVTSMPAACSGSMSE